MSELAKIVCDVCGAEHDSSWAVADGWAKVDVRSFMLPPVDTLDVCPACAAKVGKVLGIQMPKPYSEQR